MIGQGHLNPKLESWVEGSYVWRCGGHKQGPEFVDDFGVSQVFGPGGQAVSLPKQPSSLYPLPNERSNPRIHLANLAGASGGAREGIYALLVLCEIVQG